MVTLLHLMSAGPIALSFVNLPASLYTSLYCQSPSSELQLLLGGAAIRLLFLCCKLLAFHGASGRSAEKHFVFERC